MKLRYVKTVLLLMITVFFMALVIACRNRDSELTESDLTALFDIFASELVNPTIKSYYYTDKMDYTAYPLSNNHDIAVLYANNEFTAQETANGDSLYYIDGYMYVKDAFELSVPYKIAVEFNEFLAYEATMEMIAILHGVFPSSNPDKYISLLEGGQDERGKYVRIELNESLLVSNEVVGNDIHFTSIEFMIDLNDEFVSFDMSISQDVSETVNRGYHYRHLRISNSFSPTIFDFPDDLDTYTEH